MHKTQNGTIYKVIFYIICIYRAVNLYTKNINCFFTNNFAAVIKCSKANIIFLVVNSCHLFNKLIIVFPESILLSNDTYRAPTIQGTLPLLSKAFSLLRKTI